MAYRALAYRSRFARSLGLNIRAVGRVTPPPSPLSLQPSGRNTPLAAVSLFSTTAPHGRGGMNMDEAGEMYAFDPADEAQFSQSGEDEAQFSQSGGDEGAEPPELTPDDKRTERKWSWKEASSSNSGGIDPNDTTVYPTTSELAHRILRKTWGFDEFRPRQEEVISRLIHGGSAVIVFPTASGKSLIFQIPALAFDEYDESMGQKKGGISIVVSPLIALIKVCHLISQWENLEFSNVAVFQKDQVDALQRRGVEAAAIDSTQTRESILNTNDLLRKGKLKLLYCAPERLNNEGFVETIRKTRVRLIAVDEAHCISEWGQAFRPDYLKIARFVKEMNAERVLCLTATATPKVCEDILRGFGVPDNGLFKTPTYRENLQLLAEPFDTIEDKLPKLVDFLNSNPGPSIVYVTTQRQAEEVAQALGAAEVKAMHYHAGMDKPERAFVQDQFMDRKDLTIVATIAFGMGIDKPDIRNIIHYDFPRSLEGYSQEIGRAGRDGLQSKCMLYLCGEDWCQREFFCRMDLPSKKNVDNLLRELFTSNEEVEAGDVIETNAAQESKTHDIKLNTLSLLYSQLELRFEILRAITPKYSIFRFVPSDSFESFIATDEDPIAKIMLEKVQKKRRGKIRSVDIDQISQENEIKREELVYRIQSWANQGLIELKTSGVLQRYRMLKPFPRDETDIQELIDKAYEQMEHRELEDLSRSKNVIKLMTSPGCIALGLAKHFGDEGSVGEEGCGKCQFCTTGKPLVMSDPIIKKNPVDPDRVTAILRACRVRDDPRLLAKVAFGISSPRITKERCGNGSHIFGSMADCDFDELMTEFANHCTPEEE
ncbi:unnamed protein product [Tuber aestivum]|uniref:DNA 3'-5' helicase n=1 Tax=Tuber aestivum TaxID=59557 RepID=A0A292Q7S0_9PEZI|nr:unnamed protein product [Tuber aestivum]